MSVYYEDDLVRLYHGDCLDVLRADLLGYDHRLGYFPPAIPDASVDAVVTDPPYGLEFMGKGWDAPWSEKGINADAGFGGGGFSAVNGPSYTGSTNPACLNCGGKRRGRRDGTAIRAVCLCPDGGKFPNVRAVEMRAFQEWCEAWTAECLRVLKPGGHLLAFGGTRTWHRLACAVEDAGFEIRDSIAWIHSQGFPKSLNLPGGIGTALKPAFEPVVCARKPLIGTVALNVERHGTGALNIDACRAATSEADKAAINAKHAGMDAATYERRAGVSLNLSANPMPLKPAEAHAAGRWPTNVVLDDTQAAVLDEQSGASTSRVGKPRGAEAGDGWGMTAAGAEYDDTGGASRFFPTFRYEAKAPTSERPKVNGTAHPTVKPLDFMRWLVRLVTPPGGTVLEPFAGSGTTVEACVIEGFRCIAIEKTEEYLPLTVARINRQRNPVEAIRLAGDDLGLFEGLEGMGA